MNITRIALPLMALGGVVAIVAAAGGYPSHDQQNRVAQKQASDSIVDTLDTKLANGWSENGVPASQPAADLAVLRRLSLALHGTIPSLEEIRRFQNDIRPERLTLWTRQMMKDPRFGDYFGERLARVFVGAENGPFIVFRRDRFTGWLSEQLQQDQPYDKVVRQMISETGLWTGRPATNFVTVAVIDNNADENKLAGRAVRAFLGQRIDCAQCHDHPFGDWRQEQFEGLAAYFGEVSLSPFGVEDRPRDYLVQDHETLDERVVKPAVPFGAKWLPQSGTPREKLAAWITHEDNRRFGRATANRVWGLLFGKPWSSPVDDLADPPPREEPDLLDLLGNDFRRHNGSLKRLIETITATRAFRGASTGEDGRSTADQWAVFPLVRLRPEQVIGSVLQSASLKTIDRNSHLIVRAIRLLREGDFVREYGDLGDSELDVRRGGTIPQRLIMMNGKLTRELFEANLFSTAGRIAGMAPTDEIFVETAFLVCLTRKPSESERLYFVKQLQGAEKDGRKKIVEDLFWSLINSTEFSWNH